MRVLAPSGGKIQWAVQAGSAKNHGKSHFQFHPIKICQYSHFITVTVSGSADFSTKKIDKPFVKFKMV